MQNQIVTRYNTFFMASLGIVSTLVDNYIVNKYGSSGAGTAGIVLSGVLAVLYVSTGAAILFGMALSYRSKSLLGGFIVILLSVPPIGPALVAVWMPGNLRKGKSV